MASRRRPNASRSLAQYGLFDMNDPVVSDDGDSDLEAELAAIAGGGGGNKRQKPEKPKAKLIPDSDLDLMVAASLRDVPSDEEVSDGEDDPDILNELSELSTERDHIPDDDEPPTVDAPRGPNGDAIIKMLEERIAMYTTAEQNAKSSGDSSKARRFGRGLKTLKDQLKESKSGKFPKDEDIPPPVSVTKQPPAAADPFPNQPIIERPSFPAPSVIKESPTAEDPEPEAQLTLQAQKEIHLLNERKNQYKMAALSAKKSGNNALALEHMKVMKQIDLVTNAIKSGQTVDLSNMPGPPGSSPVAPELPQKEEEHPQRSTEVVPDVVADETPAKLITAGSVGEALQQRLEVYKQQEAAANEAGNSSKARRMGRIVKQYQQAIKLHSAGKPLPYDELPTPPGYAPIPGAPPPPEEKPADEPKPPPVVPRPSPPQAPSDPEDKPGKLANAGRSNSVRKMGNQIGTGHVERQLGTLLLRQKQFKEAALNAKKKGEIQEAKEFLRCAKGLEPLIDAAQGGLPVDLSTIPLPPQAKQDLEDSYDIINSEDCTVEDNTVGDIMSRLEEQLNNQLKLCMSTRDHHKALGDVAGANRFEHIALSVKQDLDVIRMAKRTNAPAPKFHYETKQFSIVQSCTDLGDNDLELTIVRGINYNVPNPKEVDTYVKFEFPYPQEEPFKDKTSLVKNTNNPEYKAVFTIPINRAQRPCLRVFKRHAVKLEVYSRGGLFTRDSVIGTVNIKLQPLETQTVLHDSFDLMDGRKAIGGKLEVKLRVRHPLLTKQVEQSTQKWLVIDH